MREGPLLEEGGHQLAVEVLQMGELPRAAEYPKLLTPILTPLRKLQMIMDSQLEEEREILLGLAHRTGLK